MREVCLSPSFIVSRPPAKSISEVHRPGYSRGIDTVRNNSHNWKTSNLTAEIGLISRRVLLGLVTAACVLPVAITVVVTVAWLLAQMHDAAAAAVLDRVALAIGILWVIDLIVLVVALAIHALGPPDDEG